MGLLSGIIDGLIYPPPGFHFLVVIEGIPQTPQDFRFQSVSGLNVNIPTESVAEGGETRFQYQLPGVPQFEKLVLKRGLFVGSFITNWCRNAIENFQFDPKNKLISLLNEKHLPVSAWHVFNAYPVKVNISEFNAEQNTLVIETLELAYQHFKIMGMKTDLLAGAATAVTDAVSGSAPLSL